jgi:soluble lytic murein transglycosylase-like protein
MQGWESLKQRSTTFIVLGLLALSTLLTSAGRERLAAWGELALEALSPKEKSLYWAVPTALTVEQSRVARWIANRHRVSVASVEQLVAAAYDTAPRFRLDPYLILAVISVESGFNPVAESRVGAIGLMQIMPKVHAEKLKDFGGVDRAADPWVNLQVGSAILREYLDRFGSEEAALKAYVGVDPFALTTYPERVFRARERMLAAAVGRVLA